MLARDAIAQQLNLNNGAYDPANLITEAAKWLTGSDPYDAYPDRSSGDIDLNNDGIADYKNSSESKKTGFSGSSVKANKDAWQDPVGDYQLSGDMLHKAIDAFNNNILMTDADTLTLVQDQDGYQGVVDSNDNNTTGDWLI